MKKRIERNFVIRNENFEENKDLLPILFGGEFVEEVENVDMFDILVMSGMFRSKSEARKNWNRTGREIPEGFTDIENIGKLNNRLTIFNPVKERTE